MNKILSIAVVFFVFLFCSCTDEPKETFGNVAGIVTTTDGEALEGASVNIPELKLTAITNEYGRFNMNEVKAGTYKFNVTCAGYRGFSQSVKIESGKLANANFQLISEGPLSFINKNLDFGTDLDELVCTIKNDTKTRVSWNVELSDSRWLSVEPKMGYLDVNESADLKFTAYRYNLNIEDTCYVTFRCAGTMYRLRASCAPSNKYLEILPNVLEFKNSNSVKFTIRNKGIETLSWASSNLASCLSLSTEWGAVKAGETDTVICTINRKVSSKYEGRFEIYDRNNVYTVSVNAPEVVQSSDLVVPDFLTAYFKFEDGVEDLCGTYSATPNYVSLGTDGVSGNCLKLYQPTETEGSPIASVRIKENLISTDFSVSFWTKSAYSDGVYFQSPSSDDYARFVLYCYRGNFWYMTDAYSVGYKGPTGTAFDETTKFSHRRINSFTEWHHIVVTSSYDVNTGYWTNTLYLDGDKEDVLKQYVTSSSGESKYPTEFWIGGNVTEQSKFKYLGARVCMDNFRIYKKHCLTDAEVKEIYQARQ